MAPADPTSTPAGPASSASVGPPPRSSEPAAAPKPAPEWSGRWNLAAAFLAWLLPGLGHFLMGQRQRAVILGISIGTLWLGGLFIGGLSVVDRGQQPAWFLGQVLIAPSFVANQYRDQLVSAHTGTFDPQDKPPFEPAYARAQEQGTLFTSLAGLLNLLAIIDVLYRTPEPSPAQGARA